MEKTPKSNTQPLWSWSQDSFWVRSSAAMVTWALSLTLQLSISTAAKCHRSLQNSRNAPELGRFWSWNLLRQPRCHHPHGHWTQCPGGAGRPAAEPWGALITVPPFPLAPRVEPCSSSGWAMISAATHSSACAANWLPASLPHSCSPNYTDHPTLKLNFPNCYINIKLHVEEWYTQDRGN